MSDKEINGLIQTGELAKGDILAGAKTTAASDTEQQASELVEENKKRKKRLIRLSILLAFVMLVLIFSTIAWFTMNKDVMSGSMAIKTDTLPFDIATKGNLVRYSDKISEYDSQYNEGLSGTYQNASGVDGTYYSSTDKLILRYDSGDSVIAPGGSGELSLYIIPKKSGSIDAYINLNIIAFTEVGDEDDSTLLEITNTLDTSSGLTSGQVDSCKAASKFIKGHIMFFGGLSESENYYYVDPITDGVIHFQRSDVVAGRAYQVPIYWMWPNTLGQLALKTNENELRAGIPVVQEIASPTEGSDKRKILDYLKRNKDLMFYKLDVRSTLGDEELEVYENLGESEKKSYDSSAIDSWIENADERDNFDRLSSGYNNADYEIGVNIKYFLIEVSVSFGEY